MLPIAIFFPISADFIVGLVIMALLLLCSALVSASEVAYFSLTPAQLKKLKKSESHKDKLVTELLETPKTLLATILIANNFVNVGAVILSTFVTTSIINFDEVAEWAAFMVQAVIVTALILFVGDITPKVLATRKTLQIARFMARPTYIMTKLFYPLSSVLVKSTSLIDKRLTRQSGSVDMEELSDAIELTSNEEERDEERKILQGIVSFGDIEVKEIMKARIDIMAVETGTGYKELLRLITDTGYSRMPVYEESFDNVKGILYIKDLLPHLDKEGTFNWQSLLRKAFFVPENKRINDLLEEFQQKKIHMAIVVDEYGGTSGLVTLEDIIEEIVGEINDEHDVEETEFVYRKIDEQNYIFEGKISLNDFCKILEIDDNIFDEVKGESDSLAGLILEITGKIPQANEKVSFKKFLFTVKQVDNRRIKRVHVSIMEDKKEEEKQGEDED
jgi:putative hemolysin